MRTSVRRQSLTREPVPVVVSTIGERPPTALALACCGRLAKIAEKMGRGSATLFKWSEGARGPEHDLLELFPAAHAAGVSRDEMGMVIARIVGAFEAEYAADLPPICELHGPETMTDTAEDRAQMALVLADNSPSALAAWLPTALAERAKLDTMIAAAHRDLRAAGLLA